MTRMPGMNLVPGLKKSPAVQVSTGAILMDLLRRQQDLYKQLSTLAAQQSEFVRTGATEKLMTVLASRSRIIEQIEPLDKQIQPYRANWDATLTGMPEQDRAAVQSLMAEVQQMLANILKQDEEDRKLLMEQKEEVGAQINKTVTGVQLNRAYGVKQKFQGGGLRG